MNSYTSKTMVKSVAGAFKMRLGPLKARIVNHSGTARAILKKTNPDEREMRVVLEKLGKTCEALEKLSYEWISVIEDQEAEDDKKVWETDYKGLAEGETGFLMILDEARDLQAELSGTLETFVRHISTIATGPFGNNNNAQSSSSHVNQSIRLPPQQLPLFNGKAVDWTGYWSIFESAIDKNLAYGDAEKFGYLLMTLAKQQQEEVRGFQLTTDGYDLAKKYLLTRYGNQEAIFYRELKELVSSKRLCDVRNNWVVINRILLQLGKLGEDVTSQSLLQDIEHKFPEWVIREVVAEQVQFVGKWLPKNFLDTVDKIAKIREMTFDIGFFQS